MSMESGSCDGSKAEKSCRAEISGACVAELGRGEGLLLRPDFSKALVEDDDGSYDSMEDNEPTFVLEAIPQNASEHKVKWVNEYLTKMFGDKARLLKVD